MVGERGVGEVPIRRGDIHCGTLYIYVLFGAGGDNESVNVERGVQCALYPVHHTV